MKRQFDSLSTITRQASKAIDDVSSSSARLARHNTSTLCGTVGGFLGLAGAYALSLVFPISLPIVGLIGTGLGISGGVLSFRLFRGEDAEYRLDRNRIACDEIIDRIKRLPPGTPKDVREELWATYRALNSVGTVLGAHPAPSRQQAVPVQRQVGYDAKHPPPNSDAEPLHREDIPRQARLRDTSR